MSGRFITFEGPEGSGKSTQMGILAQRLEKRDIAVVCAREPGGTDAGEAIRNILLSHDEMPLIPTAELLLFEASRAQLTAEVIQPALKAGKWVLCDRFSDSTLVYQGYARGVDLQMLSQVDEFSTRGTVPCLTLLLELDIHEGLARLRDRHGNVAERYDRFERQAFDFHERVGRGYSALAAKSPNRIRRIAAEQPVESVAADIWQVVEGRLLLIE